MSNTFNVYNPINELLDRIIALEESSGAALPASLQSIANLTTNGGEMLYTIGTDNYALQENVTEFGRTFLVQTSTSTAQDYIGVRVGTDVQAFSNLLSGLASTSLVNNDIIYATSATTFNKTPSTSFGRDLLAETDASSLAATIGTVTTSGGSSTDNAIVRWNGTGINSVQNSSATIDDSGNLTANGIVTNTLDPSGTNLTVGASEIPTAFWANVASLNQSVASTASPQFSTATIGTVNLSDPITDGSQAATKNYVDNAVIGGLQPLEAVRVATIASLSATYNSGSETFTASSNGAISIDGVALSLNDRILVKDQNGGGTSENGVYFVAVVGDGSNPYQITRSTDFNQAAQPIAQNSFIFVSEGSTLAGTQWILQETVTTIDTDPVNFSQFGGGGSTLTAGNGIDISGNIISVDASSTFQNTPLDFSQGGTNTTSFGAGDRIIKTNAGNTALEVSTLTENNIVDLNSVQTLTNKTLTATTNTIRATQLGTTTSDVIINTAAAPSAGQVLTAINGTSANWQSVSVNTNRTVTVATSGGDYTSIAAAIADIGTNARLTPVASSSAPITIQVAPGEYTEPQIIVPPYVTIEGIGRPLNCRIVASDPTDDLFILSFAGGVKNIDARGVTTSGKAAFRVSYATGAGPTTIFENCIARGCPIGFYCSGTGAQFSSVALIYGCNSVSSSGAPVDSAYLADAGGILIGFNLTVSGFFAGTINLQKGYDVTGTGSLMSLYSSDVSFVGTAFNVDSGAEFRITGGNAGNFEDYGLDQGSGNTVARIISVFFQDNTGLFPNQIPVRTQSGSRLLELTGCILRGELAVFDAGTSITGFFSSPGESAQEEIRNQIVGELSVGLPGKGFESTFGEGDSSISDMIIFTFNANTTTFTDETDDLKFPDGTTVTIFPSNTAGDILYMGNTARTFGGIKITVDTAANPTGCNSASTEPPNYLVLWEYWDGSSWVEFRIFNQLSSAPYTPYRRDNFRSGSFQYRFENIQQTNPRRPIPSTATFITSDGPGGPNKWVTSGAVPNAWTQTTVNGTNAFWVRARLISPLTVVPTVDQIKLHTNRAEINANGTIEFFGSARQRKQLGINIRNFLPMDSANPSNRDIYISDNINFVGVDVRFLTGVNDGFCTEFQIPSEICTSCPTIFSWKWFPEDASVGNVRWKVSWAYVKPNAIDNGAVSIFHISAATAPTNQVTEQSITFTQPTPGVTRGLVQSFVLLDLSDTLYTYENPLAGLGDSVFLSIQREGADAADTYIDDINLVNTSILYLKSTIGASLGN